MESRENKNLRQARFKIGIPKRFRWNRNNSNNNLSDYTNKNMFKNSLKNDRSNSTYSILPISEVTQGAVEVWATLPDEIRHDPSLASFRHEHERIHGKFLFHHFCLCTC